MSKTRRPTYLFKSPQNIYYFRVRIPSEVRIRYASAKKEIRKSLHTSNFSIAQKRALKMWVLMEASDYSMKNDDSEPYLKDVAEEKNVKRFIFSLNESGLDATNGQSGEWEKFSDEDKFIDQLKRKIGFIEKEKCKKYFNNDKENSTDDYFISDKITEYMEEYFEKKKRIYGKISNTTKIELSGIYKEFLSIIGENLNISSLNKSVIRNYSNCVWSLPSNYSKKKIYKDKSIAEILSMEIPNEQKRSPITFNKHILRVKQFLSWALLEGYITDDLSRFLNLIPDNVKPNQKKDCFSDDELRLLFNNPVYECGDFKKPSRYWIPLMALFTGARGEELAQLYPDDVEDYQNSGIYVFRFRENDERMQGLKNQTAPRIVPVHSKLIALGFLEFVDSQKKGNMLFPELRRSNGKNFKSFGNNFNRKSSSGWKWKCGVAREHVSFHSFRHNVVNFLVDSKIEDRISCGIIGHKYKGTFLVENYIKDVGPEVLQMAVNKIDFPSIDWLKIKKLKW